MKPFASLQVATILSHPNLKCFAFALKVHFKRKTAAGEEEEKKKMQCMRCLFCCVSKVAASSITLTVFIYLGDICGGVCFLIPCLRSCAWVFFSKCLYCLMRLLVDADSLPYVHEHIREPRGKDYFPLTHNGSLFSCVCMQQTERGERKSCCDVTD